ncbi:diguanylate cyclase [Pseudidiomarina sp.]|uniref:sensor domain-containing diguanylate cyclase n=1 Tax=Pseudidiomarina sp. TaxID=2081707 RepID=UPI00299E4C45|nr:diguanylate cyclase [Pseudidiomarina sp.]MDX1706716.1 diguanylate cyclase [Pseudidiomarina sp.]
MSDVGWVFRYRLLWLIAGAAVYYISARLSMSTFSLGPENLALVWFPAGIGLAMIKFFGWRALPFIFIASYTANLPGMSIFDSATNYTHTGISAAANTFESALAYYLLCRVLPDGMRRFADILPFLVIVCLIPTAINASLLVPNLLWGGYIELADAKWLWMMLVLTNSLGILIVYPLISAFSRIEPMYVGQMARCFSLFIICMGLVYLAFTLFSGFIFLLFPALLFLAVQGRRGTAYVALTLTVCMVVALASHDPGPFATGDITETRLMLLTFLYTIAILVLGSELHQRELMSTTSAKERWRYKANHDPLTGLGNRLLFMPLLDNEMKRAERMERPFSLALIDIDNFKQINDKYGHMPGDEILKAFSTLLLGSLRDIDVAARMGGDEFAVLFPEAAATDAESALKRLREELEKLDITVQGTPIKLTISVGLVEFHPDRFDSADCLLSQVDHLLYDAKRQGRDRIHAQH